MIILPSPATHLMSCITAKPKSQTGRTLRAKKERKKKKDPSGLFSTEDASNSDLADRNEHQAPNFHGETEASRPDWAYSQVKQPAETKKAKTSVLPVAERETPLLYLTTCFCILSFQGNFEKTISTWTGIFTFILCPNTRSCHRRGRSKAASIATAREMWEFIYLFLTAAREPGREVRKLRLEDPMAWKDFWYVKDEPWWSFPDFSI